MLIALHVVVLFFALLGIGFSVAAVFNKNRWGAASGAALAAVIGICVSLNYVMVVILPLVKAALQ